MKKTALVMLAAVAMAASVAQATPVFEDNFDTIGALSSAKYSGLPTTSATLEFDAVANTIFGGSGNTGMLKAMDHDNPGLLTVTTKMVGESLAAGWINLSIYDAETNSGTTNDFFRLTLVGPNQSISFDDGRISVPGNGKTGGFTVGTAAAMAVYFNSTSVATLVNGVSVPANSIAVYRDGALQVTSNSSTNPLTSSVTNVTFGTNNTESTLFYADNFAINNVPEPMGASLLALTAGAMLLRRRA